MPKSYWKTKHLSNTPAHMNAKFPHSFDNLSDLITFISQEFLPDIAIPIANGRNIKSRRCANVEVPAYLYRGESSEYRTTTSSMCRLRQDNTLSQMSRNVLDNLTQRVDKDLQKLLNINSMLSAGFLQHYGMPTELLDLTNDLEVAAFFASQGTIDSKGAFCVLPVKTTMTKAIILDLTQHPSAERPRRQAAYAFYHKSFVDLKDKECIDQLQLKWFSFTLRKADVERYGRRHDLLDVQTDKVAGILQLIVDDFDKFDDKAARWLAEHTVPAPFAAKVIDFWEHAPRQPKTIELVPLREADLPYNEKTEREKNYQKWSASFPETRPHKIQG